MTRPASNNNIFFVLTVGKLEYIIAYLSKCVIKARACIWRYVNQIMIIFILYCLTMTVAAFKTLIFYTVTKLSNLLMSNIGFLGSHRKDPLYAPQEPH